MNIEAYNLDSLRKLVRDLQDENKRLKMQLEQANIAYESDNPFEEKIETNEEYDPDQGERILSKYITEDLVNKYFAYTSVLPQNIAKYLFTRSSVNILRKIW